MFRASGFEKYGSVEPVLLNEERMSINIEVSERIILTSKQ